MRNVYIVSAVRTAVGKANRGALIHTRADDMAAAVMKEAVNRAGIAPEAIEDVVLGCAFPEGSQGMNMARVAVSRAGLPDAVPAMTINRFCSSGLEAIAICAAKIQAGLIDVAIAGGAESMSQIPMGGRNFAPNPVLVNEYPEVYTSMGNCGDSVARDFGIARAEMDAFALRSNQRAAAAIEGGAFKEQIVALDVPTAKGTKRFDTDEGPRKDTSLEALAALKPAFNASPKHGFCTAGNSSQMSDGAAAVCLMSEEAMKRLGAKPIGRFLAYNVAAGSPKYLGPAQLTAIPKACALAGLTLADIDLFESNEAFSSQCLYVIRELKLDVERVNVNGGAIALGHPLGCTGAKLTVQALYELKRRSAKHAVITMCIGGGMGAAGVIAAC